MDEEFLESLVGKAVLTYGEVGRLLPSSWRKPERREEWLTDMNDLMELPDGEAKAKLLALVLHATGNLGSKDFYEVRKDLGW